MDTVKNTMDMVRVTMDLSPIDVANANIVCNKLNSGTNALAVGDALMVTAELLAKQTAGSDILIRHKDGALEKIVIGSNE